MTGKKVLVIDDEEDLRDALRVALEGAGLKVLLAADGERGLALALEEKPDLTLLDINMPGMSGHEVLSKLRRDSWGKGADVILLTNADDATNIVYGVGEKACDYIIKTQVSLTDITKKAKQHLAGYHE